MKPRLHLLLLAFVLPLIVLASATSSSSIMDSSEAWASPASTPGSNQPPAFTPLPRNYIPPAPPCPTAAAGMPPTYCSKPAKVIKIQ